MWYVDKDISFQWLLLNLNPILRRYKLRDDLWSNGPKLFKNIKVMKEEKSRNQSRLKETKEIWELHVMNDLDRISDWGNNSYKDAERNNKIWIWTMNWGLYPHFLILMSVHTLEIHTKVLKGQLTLKWFWENTVCVCVHVHVCVFKRHRGAGERG